MSSTPPCYTLLSTDLVHRLTFFSSIKYCIGGIEYSANDIEHGILRGNRPSPASPAVLIGRPQWAGGYFKQHDPRMQQVRCSLVLCACCMVFWLWAVSRIEQGVPSLHGQLNLLMRLGLSSVKRVHSPSIDHLHLGQPCIKQVRPPCTHCQQLGLPCTLGFWASRRCTLPALTICIWGNPASSGCALRVQGASTLKTHAQSVWGHTLQQVSPASADRSGQAQSPAQLVGLCSKAGRPA